MNQVSDRTNNFTQTDVAEVEEQETIQAAEQKTNSIADVVSPETLVVNEPPPKPDYPRYRVSPNERIRLTNISPDACEHYKKKERCRKRTRNSKKAASIVTRTLVR